MSDKDIIIKVLTYFSIDKLQTLLWEKKVTVEL
jgi:hypothetical protein